MAYDQTVSGKRWSRGDEPGYVRQAYDTAADAVSGHPATSLLTAWGVGFGVGLVLGIALAAPRREEHAMARFGRSMLDSMSRYFPDAWSKHFSS